MHSFEAKSPSETDLSLTQSIIRQSPFSVGSVSTGNKRAKSRRGRDRKRSMKMRDGEGKRDKENVGYREGGRYERKEEFETETEKRSL